MGQAAKTTATEKDAAYSEREPVNTQHFIAAHTTHGQGESHEVRLTDPTYHRHLNSKPLVINFAKS